MTRKILNFMSTRLGFVLTLLTLYWLKTMWAYSVDFNLDIQGAYQVFLAMINPIPLGLLLIGLALYIKKTKIFYILAFSLYTLLFVWLISNSIYYREFSDFVTVNTMLASSSVSAGLGEAALELFRVSDLIYIIDFPILGFLFIKNGFDWMTVLLISELALPLPHYLVCSFLPTSFWQKLTDLNC